MKEALRLNESCAFLVSDREITFYGCEGVEEYSDVSVRLRLHEMTVRVGGSGLVLSTFAGAEITVRGRICDLAIEGRRKA